MFIGGEKITFKNQIPEYDSIRYILKVKFVEDTTVLIINCE